MSSNISNILISEFSEMAHMNYQQMVSKLKDTVRVAQSVGLDYQFPTFGRVTGVEDKPRLSPVTLQNAGENKKIATAKSYEVAIGIDNFDQFRTNVDTRRAYAEQVTAEVNRWIDRIIVNALAQSSNVVSVSNTLNKAGLITIRKSFTNNSVPEGDRFGVISAGAEQDILTDTELTNQEYMQGVMLPGGTLVNRILGFNLRPIGSVDSILPEGDSATRTKCFFYHKNALGLAINQDLQVDIVPRHDLGRTWQVIATAQMGAIIIDTTGVHYANIDN